MVSKATNLAEALARGAVRNISVQAAKAGLSAPSAELVSQHFPRLSEPERNEIRSMGERSMRGAADISSLDNHEQPAITHVPLMPSAFGDESEGDRRSTTIEVTVDPGDRTDPFLVTVTVLDDGLLSIAELIAAADKLVLGIIGQYPEKFGVDPTQVKPIAHRILSTFKAF